MYRLYGRLPSEVYDQTPHDLLAVMFVKPLTKPPSVPLDSVPGLAKLNKAREKAGLAPTAGRGLKSVLQSVPDA